MMEYEGFCDKYGRQKMKRAARLSPVALNLAIEFSRSASIPHTALSTVFAYGAGFLGFYLGATTHKVANSILSDKHMKYDRGVKIVRRAQAAAFAVPVAVALAFSSFILPEPEDIDKALKEKQNHELRLDKPDTPKIEPDEEIILSSGDEEVTLIYASNE